MQVQWGAFEKGGWSVWKRVKGNKQDFTVRSRCECARTQPTRLTPFICTADFHTSEADLFRHPAGLHGVWPVHSRIFKTAASSTASVDIRQLKIPQMYFF